MAQHGSGPEHQPADLITNSNIVPHTFENATGKLQEIHDNHCNQLQEVYDVLKTEVNIFQRERDHFMEVSKKLESVHFPSIIKLNIGGKIYQTTMDTIKKDPESMLAVMFSQRFDLSKDETGAYFIDRDGELFRPILNFLRTGNLLTEKLPEIRDDLLAEAEFYQIKGIIDILNPILPPLHTPPLALPIFSGSKIMQEEFRIYFQDWLPKDQFKWKLAYSATKDGWQASDFHRCCDGMSPTITLLQTKVSGYIFGGYTDKPWQSSVDFRWSLSKENFVFSIVNVKGISPVKFQANEEGGTCHCNGWGPCFGSNTGGNTFLKICIGNMPNSRQCYSSLAGNGYDGSIQDEFFFAGSETFYLTALDVFSPDV